MASKLTLTEESLGESAETDSLSSTMEQQLHISSHNVHVHSYRSPHFCDFCGVMLFGLVKQGLKCDGCGFNFHKRCIYKLPNNCSRSRSGPSPSPSGQDLLQLQQQQQQQQQLQQQSQQQQLQPGGATCGKSWSGGRPLWLERQLAERIKVPHTFDIHSYTKPTVCHFCRKLMYGLFRQGYQCKDCKYNCHKKCLPGVPKSCEGVILPEEGGDGSAADQSASAGSNTAGGSNSPVSDPDDESLAGGGGGSGPGSRGGGGDMGSEEPQKPPLDPKESANIPLMRVFQSIKQTKKQGSSVLRENWLVYYTDRCAEMKRHFWRLDSRGVTLYPDESTNRFYKEILLTEIVSVASCSTQATKDYVFALKTASGTTYFIGGGGGGGGGGGCGHDGPSIPADLMQLSRQQAVHFEAAVRAALLPVSASRGSGGQEATTAAASSTTSGVSAAASNFSSAGGGGISEGGGGSGGGGAETLESQFDVRHEEILGSGQFGTVYAGVGHTSGQEVAIKVIDKLRFPTKQETQLKNEVSILQSLNHEGVVRLHKMFETPRTLFVVMEKMSGDMLEMILSGTEGRLSERVTKYLVAQILCALRYLHTRCVVHCDLKPENVLLAPAAGHGSLHYPQIKLCDFGFARIIGEKSFRKSIVGTPAYLAPEVLKYKGYNRSIDMWSVGVITYVSLSGTFPFNEDEDIADQIKNASFMYPPVPWETISVEATDLIDHLMDLSIKDRYTVALAWCHKWIKEDYACWCDMRKLELGCNSRYLTDESDDERWETFRSRRGLPYWEQYGWNSEMQSPVYYSAGSEQ